MLEKLTDMILDRVIAEREAYALELDNLAANIVREGVILLSEDGQLYFRWKEDSNYPPNHEEDHYHEVPGFYRGGNGQGVFGELIEEPTEAELKLIMNFVSRYNIMTFAEASEKYDVDVSTLRHRQRDGRFEPGDCRKSGNTWLVTKSAMERLYGGE